MEETHFKFLKQLESKRYKKIYYVNVKKKTHEKIATI